MSVERVPAAVSGAYHLQNLALRKIVMCITCWICSFLLVALDAPDFQNNRKCWYDTLQSAEAQQRNMNMACIGFGGGDEGCFSYWLITAQTSNSSSIVAYRYSCTFKSSVTAFRAGTKTGIIWRSPWTIVWRTGVCRKLLQKLLMPWPRKGLEKFTDRHAFSILKCTWPCKQTFLISGCSLL